MDNQTAGVKESFTQLYLTQRAHANASEKQREFLGVKDIESVISHKEIPVNFSPEKTLKILKLFLLNYTRYLTLQLVRKHVDEWKSEGCSISKELFDDKKNEFNEEQFADFFTKAFFNSSSGAEFFYFPILRHVIDWIERHKDDEIKCLVENFCEVIESENANLTKVMKIDETRFLFVSNEKLNRYILKIAYLVDSMFRDKLYLKFYELPNQKKFWELYNRGETV